MRSLCCFLSNRFRKITFVVILSFFSLFIKAQIVINELGIAPTTGNGAGGGEFIELYNKGAGSVDISCYVIVFAGSSSAQAWTISIPSNTILACGDYYLIGGAGNAPSPNSAWVNTTVGGKAWINNYSSNGITTITSSNGLNINTAKCTGKGNLPPGNLADAQGQVSLLTSSGSVVASVSYNSGNYSSIYSSSFSNPATSCTGLNPIPSIANATANVNANFSSSGNQGIYLDATGNYAIETELTPGKSNALNTTDGASQIASTCCVSPTITTQPSSATQSLCLNAAATALTIVATASSGTNSYQWYRNTTASNTGGTIITGATSSTYTPPTTSAGTSYYYCVVTNTTGCNTTSNVSGPVIVKSPSSSTTSLNVCSSDLPYTWNGTAYNAAGTYTKTLTNAVGCDSVATLVLTVKATSSSSTSVSVCPSDLPYTWNGTAYSAAGTYTKTLTNAAGCDSVATLVLTVKSTSSSSTSVSVCPSALPYVWNGTAYSTAGTYTKTLTNAAGCDSVATLDLSINAVITTSTSVSICPNVLPYIWNGTSYSAAGSFSKTFTSITGCDSIATLVLTVKPTSTSSTVISICANALPYNWNGTSYNAAGTYTKTLVNAVGCDSIATLVLTVKATSTSSTSVSICPSGLPYTWNGTAYSAAGTYTKTLVNAVGCDSIATLVLTIKATSTSTTAISICPIALPYTWNGTAYNAAGTYTKTLTNAAGCDSVATLILTIKATSTSTTSLSVCSNNLPYTWNGTAYNAAGTYTKTLTNAVGCDSIATLVLSIKAASASSVTVSICPSGLPYVWNGTSYSAAGTYTQTFTNAIGCDSIATLVLTVKATSTSTSNINVCPNGLPYTWNGTVYNAAGTYTKTYNNAVGCDSVATLVLTVKQPTTSTTNKTICTGSTFTWNGTVYSTAGTYTKTLTNAAGCDSIATLNLSIENFVINLSAAPIPAYGGATFTATITANAAIASSVWQPSNLFVNNLSSQSIISPDTSFTLSVTATSVNGCKNSASKAIAVVPSNNVIYIPNALTPAATGTDAGVIKVYGTSIKTASLLVYNQWGQLIFQTDTANTFGWDGTFNGVAQPSGVYTYVARIVFQNRKVEVRSGSINLIR